MEDRHASLASLELHLGKLFSGKCSNEEIQQIQQSLDAFSKQKGAWRDALYFLSHSDNQNVFMYSLVILEGVTRRDWSGLSAHEKLELRTTLYRWVLERHSNIPYFVRNKAVQLVVHIGRSDWPREYAEFYDNILSLISSGSTTLGLLFLQTVSEEFGASRNDVLSQRKEELKVLLLQYVPQTFTLLTALLQSAWDQYSHSTVSTPPPSPTHCTKNEGSFKETEAVSRMVLQCFTHFFSWIPITFVTPVLLELIFNFVRVGAKETSMPQFSSSLEPSVSVTALGAINEILYKNFIPVEFEDFLCVLFRHTCSILQSIVESKNILTSPSHQFLEKIVELVHLLVSGQLQRIEKRENITHFLSLFYKLTFDQVDWDGYLSCLETWQCFVAHLKRLMESSQSETLVSSYSSSLIPLSETLLQKIFFMNNGTKLEELDDLKEEDMESEFHKVVQLSADIFLSSAELTKNQTLSLLTEPFQRCISSYESLAGIFKSNNGLPINSKVQLKELRYLTKDLATILQLMGRLSELHMKEPLPNSQTIVETLLRVSSCGVAWGSFQIPGDNDLKQLLMDVHAQCLSSLQSWCFWLTDLTRLESPPEATVEIINAFIDSAVNALNSGNTEKLFNVGLELLLSTVNSIRSPNLWTCPSWNKLYVSFHDFHHLPQPVQRKFVQLIIGSSVMTWRDCSIEEQHWNERQLRFQTDVDKITSHAKTLIDMITRQSGALQQGKDILIKTLRLLTDLATMAREETTPSKRVTSTVITPWIDLTLTLLPVCSDQEITEEVINFYLATFDGLLHQIGTSQAEKVIRTLLEIYSQQNIEQALKQECPHGIKAIEQLLKLFQIIVKEPAAPFRKFLPQILGICLNNVFPFVIQAAEAHEMKEAFYQLLSLILSHHWRFFFKGSVLSTYQSQGFGHEEVENRGHFLMILNAFGQSFVSAELSVFKLNLEAMQSLNAKWKLYSKNIFRDVAPHFVHTLLNVMVNGFHELLREDIAVAVHAMALPDFESFFRETLTDYLARCEGLEDSQRLALKNHFSNESDLPTFCKNLQQFAHDLQCYRTANAARV